MLIISIVNTYLFICQAKEKGEQIKNLQGQLEQKEEKIKTLEDNLRKQSNMLKVRKL